MEFRRITSLPPYVFTIIDSLKVAARRDGADIIDLGFGNPDLPSPQIAVDKLSEAAHNERNHRYSASRGIPSCARPRRTTTSTASASTSTPRPR
jgi:alanine-synthesizing transaminase